MEEENSKGGLAPQLYMAKEPIWGVPCTRVWPFCIWEYLSRAHYIVGHFTPWGCSSEEKKGKVSKGGSVDTALASNLSSTPGSHKVEGEMDFCVLPTCAVESTPPTLNKQCNNYFFISYPHGSYSLGENQSGLEFCLSQSSKMCFLEAPLVCF